MRYAIRSGRYFWVITLGLLLAVRLLAPAGYMPEWRADQLQISVCEDAGAQHHGKSDKSSHSQPCPYAAASAAPFLSPPDIPFPASPILASIAPFGLGKTGFFLQRKIERPPSRAPPGQA